MTRAAQARRSAQGGGRMRESAARFRSHASVVRMINRALRVTERKKASLAVLYVDLDRFCVLNESFGHAVGDRVLGEVGKRIRSCIRASDGSAHAGRDEFIVVLENIDSEASVAAIGQKIMGAIREPMRIDDHELRLTASTGIALFPADSLTSSSLLVHSQLALAAAKKAGGNAVHRFNQFIGAEISKRLRLEMDLRRAIDGGQFRLVYQPKLTLDRNETCVEALIRWDHPTRGLVHPAEFIPAAEECGLIQEIGNWTVDEACRALADWDRASLGPLKVAVNISPSQLKDDRLCERIVAATQRYGVDPADLELEITENSFIEEPQLVVRILGRLREVGISLSLDDFGTGYSSLSMLRRLPIDTLKIDRSFVQNVEEEQQDAEFVRIIVMLANTLGLTVAVEGIETPGQMEILSETGCEIFQGFYYARPMPFADLHRWTKSRLNKFEPAYIQLENRT